MIPDNIECPNCDGQGFTVFAGHICLGDDGECARFCPIPMQEFCQQCQGTGQIDSEYMEELSARAE